jgi:3',5'-cyclic AMP phosphodiesterase CpdA
VNPELVEALAAELRAYAPHVVAVSGDLTQRAKNKQFESAQQFLVSLPSATVIVPGNHDIAPFHAPVERLFRPFLRYQRGISEALHASYVDDELLVMGLNTADPLRRKEGKVRRKQIEWMCSLAKAYPQAFSVLVSHHPIVGSAAGVRARAPWGNQPLLSAVEDAGIKLMLAGHLHESFSGTYAARIGATHSVLVVQASTATSTRLRGHPNAYNRICVAWPNARIEVRIWDGTEFLTKSVSDFEWDRNVVRTSSGTTISDSCSERSA